MTTPYAFHLFDSIHGTMFFERIKRFSFEAAIFFMMMFDATAVYAGFSK